MKKHYLIFLGILLFLPSVFQAKTLVVREYGRGTLYSNLQQAHNAANDGDTLAVDAAADGSWEEGTTVTISKQVYLTTLQNRKLKLINGLEIKLLNNRKLTVTDLEMSSLNSIGQGSLIVANCKINGGVYIGNKIKFTIIKSEVNEKINCFHVKAIGNRLLKGMTIDTTSNIFDSIIVVGNIIGSLLEINKLTSVFVVNNFFDINDMPVPICKNGQLVEIATGIFYKNFNANEKNNDLISNNTIYYRQRAGGNYIFSLNGYQSRNLLVHSNAIFYSLNSTARIDHYCNNYSSFMWVSYLNFENYGVSLTNNHYSVFNSNNGGWINESAGSKNYFGNSIPAIDSLGRLSGPEFTDKGLDLPEFSDIDLTRNDIGTEGGPWPISNFWGPNASKAWVGWLDLPLKISTPSTPIQIKATGINKD